MSIRRVRLAKAPTGLFWHGETLAMKSEYRTEQGAIEAYVVASGEFFWGGVSGAEAQRDLMVEPIPYEKAVKALWRQ